MTIAAQTKILVVRPVPATPKVTLDLAWDAGQSERLAAGYTSAIPIQIGGGLYLFAYNKADQHSDIYRLEAAKPWLTPLASKINLEGGPWDTINTFVLGNEPCLLTYRADSGAFGSFHH